MKRSFLIALLALTFSTAHAQVPVQHFERMAVDAIASAEKGTVRDMLRAGHYYRTGFGVHENWSEAVRWYERAAQQSDANAAYWAGKLYLNEKKYDEAYKWFSKAVGMSLQQVEAGWELGQMYLHGLGVEQSNHRAAETFLYPAAFGYAPAQYDLALLTLKLGNPELAAHWLWKAAQQNHERASRHLTECGLSVGEAEIVRDLAQCLARAGG